MFLPRLRRPPNEWETAHRKRTKPLHLLSYDGNGQMGCVLDIVPNKGVGYAAGACLSSPGKIEYSGAIIEYTGGKIEYTGGGLSCQRLPTIITY